MTEIVTIVQIGVLFPQDFGVRERAGTRVDITAPEVMREGDDLLSMSDSTLISRVENFLDLPEGCMRQMIVQRPEEGNIMITAKTRFGTFACEYCGATFQNYADLVRHLTTARHEV